MKNLKNKIRNYSPVPGIVGSMPVLPPVTEFPVEGSKKENQWALAEKMRRRGKK